MTPSCFLSLMTSFQSALRSQQRWSANGRDNRSNSTVEMQKKAETEQAIADSLGQVLLVELLQKVDRLPRDLTHQLVVLVELPPEGQRVLGEAHLRSQRPFVRKRRTNLLKHPG